MLVIKGAYYFDRGNDTILVPHFTGDFWIVDCDKYVNMERLQEIYDDSYIDGVRDNCIEFEGEKYYHAEYSPYNVDKDWELLSDLSELEHLEEDYDF
jgi:hypothetical protein